MAEILIGVEITQQEADVFRKMRESGCFDLKDANCTLNFDKKGRLLKIEKRLFTDFSLQRLDQ
jgi:hypothetical protein